MLCFRGGFFLHRLLVDNQCYTGRLVPSCLASELSRVRLRMADPLVSMTNHPVILMPLEGVCKRDGIGCASSRLSLIESCRPRISVE